MHYALQFLLLVLVAVFAGIKVTLQGQMSRRFIRTLADTLWFNVLLFAVIAVMLAVFFWALACWWAALPCLRRRFMRWRSIRARCL